MGISLRSLGISWCFRDRYEGYLVMGISPKSLGISPKSLGISLCFKGSLGRVRPFRETYKSPIVRLFFPIPNFFYMSTSSSYHTAPVCQEPSLSNGDHPWMNAVNNYQPASTEVHSFSPIGLILVLIVLIGWILCLLRACFHRP